MSQWWRSMTDRLCFLRAIACLLAAIPSSAAATAGLDCSTESITNLKESIVSRLGRGKSNLRDRYSTSSLGKKQAKTWTLHDIFLQRHSVSYNLPTSYILRNSVFDFRGWLSFIFQPFRTHHHGIRVQDTWWSSRGCCQLCSKERMLFLNSETHDCLWLVLTELSKVRCY